VQQTREQRTRASARCSQCRCGATVDPVTDPGRLAWLALALVISGAQNNRSVQLLATLSPASTPR